MVGLDHAFFCFLLTEERSAACLSASGACSSFSGGGGIHFDSSSLKPLCKAGISPTSLTSSHISPSIVLDRAASRVSGAGIRLRTLKALSLARCSQPLTVKRAFSKASEARTGSTS